MTPSIITIIIIIIKWYLYTEDLLHQVSLVSARLWLWLWLNLVLSSSFPRSVPCPFNAHILRPVVCV